MTFGSYKHSILGQLAPKNGPISPSQEAIDAARSLYEKGKLAYIHWNGYALWVACQKSDRFVQYMDSERVMRLANAKRR